MKMVQIIIMLIGCVAFNGCTNQRIDKHGSLTIKVRNEFSQNFGERVSYFDNALDLGDTNVEYVPSYNKRKIRDSKTHGGKERIKNVVDDMGEEILGTIVANLMEVCVKGIIHLVSAGLYSSYTSLSDDEVIVLFISENGKFTKTAKEGFNRWGLIKSEKVVFENPWKIEVYSLKKFRYYVISTLIEPIDFASTHFIDLEFTNGGVIRMNGNVLIGLTKNMTTKP